MDLFASLAADLSLLSGALRNPGDLERELRSLVHDLQATIASYIGLTITIAVDTAQVGFTLAEHPGQAVTSLLIPLPALTDSEAGSELVLFAGVPGAFVDLAADLAWALGLELSALVLDAHLPISASSDVVTGLRDQATVNRAVGALIEFGHTPESAYLELRRLADTDGGNLIVTAQRVLDGIPRRADPSP